MPNRYNCQVQVIAAAHEGMERLKVAHCIGPPLTFSQAVEQAALTHLMCLHSVVAFLCPIHDFSAVHLTTIQASQL